MITPVSKRKTNIPITELEQSAFCQREGNLRTKTLEEEFKSGVRWQKIPPRYARMSPEEIGEAIRDNREALGTSVFVLGHHYQREDVICYADIRGDSYLLSKHAAEMTDSEVIIFCGVHFMAETADILTDDSRKVILPNMAAGCSMADMAQTEDVEDCWEDLRDVLPSTASGRAPVVPVTYMNSTAAIKALCGENGGIVCTSSNASQAMRWALEHGERVLFLPDQHLGRNVALSIGIPREDMVLWNPVKPLGGLTQEQIKSAKIILWQGHCSVHTRFTVNQIAQAREHYPQANVIVHPECTNEVIKAADLQGSTEFIRKAVENAPSGSVWAIGTEINLVNRLANENPDKTVFCLDPVVCPCATMYRIHPAYLVWVLDGLRTGILINQVRVPADIRSKASIALERMLQLPN